MKEIRNPNHIIPAVLSVVWCGVLFFSVPKGAIYGSNTDWLPQHVALAETIRQACLEQKTLLPQFLQLGGGSNGFAFAYYGYLRPDILIGCLLPEVSMTVILIAYMLAGYLASVLLCYRLLILETKSKGAAFFGSVLFLLASCFFHTHRQVMFVNYMPFLLAALLFIKKKKYKCVTVCLTLVYLNSFYYSIAVLAVVGWYWYGKEQRKFLWNYVKAAILSVGMAAVLLLPTFLVILEHRRASTELTKITGFLPGLKFLLYSPYGVGVTVIVLYLLLAGLASKSYRRDSVIFLLLCSLGFFAWILNGTLYARGKILIPFLPILILHSVRVLLSMHRNEMCWQMWPFLPVFCCLYYNRNGSRVLWMLCDILILLFFCLGKRVVCEKEKMYRINTYIGKMQRFSRLRLEYGILLIMPLFFFYLSAESESYVQMETLQKAEQEQTCIQTEPLYRFDSLFMPLQTGNRDVSQNRAKSTMYSSVTNPAYTEFYYSLLHTPVQINNRMALLAEENPFLFQLMGIRYVETTAEKIPDNFSVIAQTGERIVAENKDVLPIAYVVKDVIPEEAFRELNEMEQLDALMKTTIINNSNQEIIKEAESAEPAVLPVELCVSAMEKSGMLAISEASSGEYDIVAGENAVLTLHLEKPLKDEILLLQFLVQSLDKKAVVIDINDIRNKLSGASAAYPNKNDTFYYQLTESEGLTVIEIRFSKGHYRISELRTHTYDKKSLTEKAFTKVVYCETTEDEILLCRAENETDGYFVTSIPMQKGIEIRIDGEKVPLLTVNTAFAGAALPSGSHLIQMSFTAPGFAAGKCFSVVCAVLFLGEEMFRLCRKY